MTAKNSMIQYVMHVVSIDARRFNTYHIALEYSIPISLRHPGTNSTMPWNQQA